MSFFNSFYFLLEIGLTTLAFIVFVRLFPRVKAEYPLLALSLYWTHTFLNVPLTYVAGVTVAMTVFFYLVTYSARSRFPFAGLTALLLLVVLVWLAKRFPLTMAFFHLPSARTSEVLQRDLRYLLGVPFTMCRLAAFAIDVTKGKFKDPSLVKFLLFILYFPTRISGPITNYRDFEFRLWRRDLGRYLEECLIPGTKRIILGVLKREVVSEILSAAALPFLFTDRCTRWELVFGIYCYYFYLYIDFSGYSDLAIGFSKVLGLNIPENFDKPFLARNPMDFWRRWHISLLNWLNEYILTPVYTFLLKNCSFLPGGVLSFIAIFITMGFAGIWHGEDERYLLYGLFNAAVLWAYRTYDNYMRTNHGALRRELNANVFITWVSRLVCFHYVLIAFMIFSVDDELILVIFRKIWNG